MMHNKIDKPAMKDFVQASERVRWLHKQDGKGLFLDVIVTLAILIIALMLAINVQAAEAVHEDTGAIGLADVSRGSLLFQSDTAGRYHPAPLLKTDVEMRISGMVVRTHLVQHFTNQSSEWVEGIYVFPLPENAAVDHLRLRIGERLIEGVIKERGAAKKIYQQAKRTGKKAALIEQERPNLFTNSVANIGPGEEVKVEIEYQQVLRYDQGVFRMRFPLAITPRYIPGTALQDEEQISAFQGNGWAKNTTQVKDASRITPPVQIGEEKINPVALHIELDAGFPLQRLESPSHSIKTTQHGTGQVTITLADAQVPATRDFELRWSPDTGQQPRAALFTENREDATYQLLMVMPPTDSSNAAARLPREVIYIIDTSGSMGGVSIRQAKKALHMALDRLQPMDRFNIIEFNSVTRQLFQGARPAYDGNLATARRFVKDLRANGGTEMMPALQAALRSTAESSHVRQIIFLTDGSVGNETQLFELINKRLGNSRLFTIGIGSAPNSYFMRKAAQFGRGTFTYISDIHEVQARMAELFSKLESPVLSDLQLQFPVAGDAEIWPRRLPDLYLGEPLLISLRSTVPQDEVEITGLRGKQAWSMRLALQGGRSESGIDVLWARRKISALMDSLQDGASQDKVRKAVIEVALRHHLVSRYTSLVAVDVTPSRPQAEPLAQRALPVNLPAGQQATKIFGRLAQTGTSAPLQLLFGVLLLLLAVLMAPWAWRRSR